MGIDERRMAERVRARRAASEGSARAARPPRLLIDDPALEAFFEGREHEAYFRSLKSIDERRGFHDRLIVVLVRVLELVDERVERVMTDNAFANVNNRSLRELLAREAIHYLRTEPYRPRTNGKSSASTKR